MSSATRFWARVIVSDGCWGWKGSTVKGGYGKIEDPRTRKATLAHRLSWELHFGPIPDGLCVLHRCDNPPCCRPEHLFLGTPRDNVMDSIRKGRMRRFSRLTPESVSRVRRMAADGRPAYAIAKEFGVDRMTIVMCVRRRTWAHIP